MLENLKNLDTRLFLYLNSRHNSFFDLVMYWASDKLFWLPFYLFIAIWLVRYFKKQAVFIFIGIALLITLSDQISSTLIRDAVGRPRPSHEPAIMHLVHLSKAGPGGAFGFVSSHASNAFALASFLIFLLPGNFKSLKYILLAWAGLIGYSRVYNGVHYPGDVLGGALLGILLGYIMARLTIRIMNYYNQRKLARHETRRKYSPK